MSTILTGRVTASAVTSLEPDHTLRDLDVRGFGVRRRQGPPSYFLQTRIKGRLRWITIGKHGSPWTPVTARKEAIRLLAHINDGGDPLHEKWEKRSAPTFADGASEFQDDHGAKLKPRTRTEYERIIARYIVPTLGKRRIADIDRADIATLHRQLAATPRMANLTVAVLSKILNWAEVQGLRPNNSNPCRLLKKYRERHRQRFLSSEEVSRLGDLLADLEQTGGEAPGVIAAIRLLLLTGARLSEILTLEWRYVDLQRAMIFLPDSKTGQKPIFLNRAAVELLQSIPRSPTNAFVIPGSGKTGHLINLQKPWSRIRRLAGIDDVRIHDLRHSFASIAASRGASLPLIGKLLGHSNAQTTQRYAHLVADPVRELNEAVGNELAAGLAGQRLDDRPKE